MKYVLEEKNYHKFQVIVEVLHLYLNSSGVSAMDTATCNKVLKTVIYLIVLWDREVLKIYVIRDLRPVESDSIQEFRNTNKVVRVNLIHATKADYV